MRIFKIYLLIVYIFFCAKVNAAEIIYSEPKQIQNFSLKDFNKKNYFLETLSGNILILHFWATWCNACYQEMKEIDFFQKTIRDKPIIVIPISEDFKNSEDIAEYYKKNGLSNLLGFTDKGNLIFKNLDISSLPTTIIINSAGYEIGRANGVVNWKDKSLVSKLLSHAAKKPVVNADYLNLMNQQFNDRITNAEAKKLDVSQEKIEDIVPEEAITEVQPIELQESKEMPKEIVVSNANSGNFSLKIRRPVNNKK